MPSIKCPRCARIIKMDESQAGGIGTCPDCGQKYRLPRKADPSPAASKKLAPVKPTQRPRSKPHDPEEEDPRPYGVSVEPDRPRPVFVEIAPKQQDDEDDSDDDADLEAPIRVKRKKKQGLEAAASSGTADLVGFLVLAGIAVITVLIAAAVFVLGNH